MIDVGEEVATKRVAQPWLVQQKATNKTNLN
jgi:hypothetical protein